MPLAGLMPPAMPTNPPVEICLVLTPAPGDAWGGQRGARDAVDPAVPGRLVRGLSARGLAVLVADDPPAAMLRLAEHSCVALIVAEPQRAGDRLGELIEAVAIYHPKVPPWAYQEHGGEGGGPWLGPLEAVPAGCRGGGDAATGGGEVKAEDEPGRRSRREAREPNGGGGVENQSGVNPSAMEQGSVPEPGARAADGPSWPEAGAAEPRWVTEAELAMLLGEAEPGA